VEIVDAKSPLVMLSARVMALAEPAAKLRPARAASIEVVCNFILWFVWMVIGPLSRSGTPWDGTIGREFLRNHTYFLQIAGSVKSQDHALGDGQGPYTRG